MTHLAAQAQRVSFAKVTAVSTLTDSDLARIQRVCGAATPGPWTAHVEGRDFDSGSSFIETAASDLELSGASAADYDFIASARQDLPRLLAEVRALRAALSGSAGG